MVEPLQRGGEIAVLLSAQDLEQLVAGQHQLRDHGHQVLEQLHIDPNGLIGDRAFACLRALGGRGLVGACGGRPLRRLRGRRAGRAGAGQLDHRRIIGVGRDLLLERGVDDVGRRRPGGSGSRIEFAGVRDDAVGDHVGDHRVETVPGISRRRLQRGGIRHVVAVRGRCGCRCRHPALRHRVEPRDQVAVVAFRLRFGRLQRRDQRLDRVERPPPPRIRVTASGVTSSSRSRNLPSTFSAECATLSSLGRPRKPARALDRVPPAGRCCSASSDRLDSAPAGPTRRPGRIGFRPSPSGTRSANRP